MYTKASNFQVRLHSYSNFKKLVLIAKIGIRSGTLVLFPSTANKRDLFENQ